MQVQNTLYDQAIITVKISDGTLKPGSKTHVAHSCKLGTRDLHIWFPELLSKLVVGNKT